MHPQSPGIILSQLELEVIDLPLTDLHQVSLGTAALEVLEESQHLVPAGREEFPGANY